MNARRFAVAAMTVAVALTAACGSDDASEPGQDSGVDSADATYPKSVGIVRFSSAEVTSESLIESFTKEAEANGVTVTAIDSQGSLDKAISGMQNFIQKDVDVIVTAVYPSEVLAGGVAAATAAGIPVMSLTGGLAPGVTANMDAGKVPALPLAELVAADMAGKGDLLVLGSKQGLPCVGREEALNEKIAGTDIQVSRNEINTTDDFVAQGTTYTQSWLAQHPAGSGTLAIWACFDAPALGAVSALQAAGRDDVKLIYGSDGTAPTIQAIQDGTMRATNALDSETGGKQFAELLPSVVEGGVDAKGKEIPTPTDLITADNIDDYLATHPDALK